MTECRIEILEKLGRRRKMFEDYIDHVKKKDSGEFRLRTMVKGKRKMGKI